MASQSFRRTNWLIILILILNLMILSLGTGFIILANKPGYEENFIVHYVTLPLGVLDLVLGFTALLRGGSFHRREKESAAGIILGIAGLILGMLGVWISLIFWLFG